MDVQAFRLIVCSAGLQACCRDLATARMLAIAHQLGLIHRFAAMLAAVFAELSAVRHGAPALRMRTFLRFSHR